MEYKTLSGHTSSWTQNTTYTNAVGKPSEVGRTSYNRSHTIEQELSKVLSNIDNQQRSEMQIMNMNKKTIENSMSAYSEKMRRISLERESMTSPTNKTVTSLTNKPVTSSTDKHVTSPKDIYCSTHSWSSMTQLEKPNEVLSVDIKNPSAISRQIHSTLHITSSESDLTKLTDTDHPARRKISDSVLTNKPNRDATRNILSPVRRCKFEIITTEEAQGTDMPPKSDAERLHNDVDGEGNQCEASILEITPFPSYRESSFYQRRMRSSRLRFAQSEYIDRTEKISRKVRPKFVNSKLGSMRFRKPLWKPRTLDTRKANWKRIIPPKPPPKPYHQIFRYSDAVKELLSYHDSNSNAGSKDVAGGLAGHASAILTVCDLCEDDFPPASSGVLTSISSNSYGSMVKHGRVGDSSEGKSVQFKLPLVEGTVSEASRGFVSDLQTNKQSRHTVTVSVNN